MSNASEHITTTCVIAGGGPAGMMAGFLFARAGLDVVVLEKHKDFLRDFRGDTIHPSTLELMWEAGLLERFLGRPHEEVREVHADFGEQHLTIGDFSRLPTRCKFIAFMPQWEFLDFLAEEGRRYPGFRLMLETEAVDVVQDGGRIAGLRVRTKSGEEEICADLVIAADGRRSCLRERATLPKREIGAAFDVVWLRLPRHESDPKEPVGRTGVGAVLVMIYRGDYWQCALVIPKGSFEAMQSKGIAALQAQLAQLAGFASDRVSAIASFDDVALLTVKMDRLLHWAKPGLLAIGDAAHAMSPVGGVGVNLAIQDAVAAANILVPILLRKERPTLSDLEKIQRRREGPTKVTQGFQSLVQRQALAPVLKGGSAPTPPAIFRILNSWAWLRQFPARFLGLGVRPEHIHTPDCLKRH